MKQGHIIFLNGVSSSGKTTLAAGLIKHLPDYFHFSSDQYDFIIEQMEDRDNGRLIPVETEIFIHRTIKMFSDYGVNLIVDHILHDKATLLDFRHTLLNYPVTMIGVHCPVEILNQRESLRGDRMTGLAARQLEFVHQNIHYDLEVDTHHHSLEYNTRLICEYVCRMRGVVESHG